MYTQKYELNHRPFENTPDPQFLYLSKIHREVLSSLIYGIQSSKGFILVSGDIGTGKTTLIHALLKEVGDSNIVVHIINPRTSFNEILSNLASKLDIGAQKINNPRLIDNIREKLKVLDNEDKRVVIIIDEAHLLSETSLEDIRILSNIETEKRKLIQIVLVGQNEIHNLLNKKSQKPLKQRIVLNRTLSAFNKKGCFEYIEHRLNIAGAQTLIFNQQALNKIWKKSKGIPRLINQICDNALLIGFALDKNVIGAKILKEVIRDMESGNRPNAQNKSISGYKKMSSAAVLFVIVFISLFLLIDPKILNTSLKSQSNTNKKITEPKILKFKIKKEAPEIQETQKISEIPTIGTLPMETKIEKKQEAYHVSEIREKLSIKPIVVITTNADRLEDKVSNRQTQIKPDEYLTGIAKKEYGVANDMIIDLIHMVNPQIKNVNKIFFGKKLVLPFIEKQDLIVKNGNGNFHIHYTSYYNYLYVNRIIKKFGKEKQLAFSIPVWQGENIVYRIYIGLFIDQASALGYMENLNFDHLPFL